MTEEEILNKCKERFVAHKATLLISQVYGLWRYKKWMNISNVKFCLKL